MNAAGIIDNVIDQTGTDAARATVLSILNEQYGTMLSDSRWLLESVSLGNTVAGTSDYALPDSVIDIKGLKVGAYTYQPISAEELWAAQADGAGSWTGRGAWYGVTYSSAGATSITLYPTPDTSGTAITVLAPVIGSDLTDSSGSTPVIPADLHGALVDGTAALLLLRVDERPDLAAPFQQRFERAIEKLRRRKNSRVSDAGGVQVKIAGVHF